MRIFTATVAPSPAGVAVLLSDGGAAWCRRSTPTASAAPGVRVTHDPDGGAIRPREIDLVDHPGIVMADTLQDVEGPADMSPPPADGADERHEQGLASIVEEEPAAQAA